MDDSKTELTEVREGLVYAWMQLKVLVAKAAAENANGQLLTAIGMAMQALEDAETLCTVKKFDK